jgi:hypothetical protein
MGVRKIRTKPGGRSGKKGVCRQLAVLDTGRGWITMRYSSEQKQFLRKMSAPLASPQESNHSLQAFDRNLSYSSVISR